jgi:hypothetical protein
MFFTLLKQLLRALPGHFRVDSEERREKYRRRLEVTFEFLARYSVAFLRA